jgi:SpoIID/LytB domain protein
MPVEVDLSEIDGFSSTTLKANRPGASVTVNGAKRWGTRTVVHTGHTITITASAGDVRVDLDGTWRAYQGYIQIQPDGQTWNVVPLEDYIAGVVPIESSAGWGASGGEAALQAQAVAARSYVLNYLYQVGHTCDSQECQVYEGDPGTNPDIGSYVRYSDEATTSTAGMVMCRVSSSGCSRADVVETQYASSTGGYTSGSGFPAVVDAGDVVGANPWHDWTFYLSVSSVEDAYPSVGTLTALKVTKRNGDGQMGGRAVTVTITGTRHTTSVDAADFADQFGLDSNWFRFSTQP